MVPAVVIAPDLDADLGVRAGSGGGAVADARCVAWVEAAGARVRVADPAAGEPLREAGGLLLAGGFFDIPPEWYGAERVARVDAAREERSRLELALLREADRRGLAVLGVCGGAQLMAVSRGGTLVQDIATQIGGALEHERGSDDVRPVHPVRLVAESRLAALLGCEDLEVNSTHHQSVCEPGRGVHIAGRAPDGVVEAIEDPERPLWLGVQWHPERLRDANSARLIEAFVRAARR